MMRSPSPLQEAVAELCPGILQTWVHDAVAAYEQAGLLLGVEGERRRLRRAHLVPQLTRPLRPAYDQLLARHAERIGEGRQLTLPWERHEDMLQREWVMLAVDFVRAPGQAQVQRLVLQGSVGLAGCLDRQTAANLLLAAAAEYPIGRRTGTAGFTEAD